MKYLLPGALKGANTCLFVLSATYVAATKSLVLESTYVVWSLLLAVLGGHRRVGLGATATQVGALFAAAALVVGGWSWDIGDDTMKGVTYGLAAGLTYALFLRTWTSTAERLEGLSSKVAGTWGLLSAALITTVVATELGAVIYAGQWWTPGTEISAHDFLIQLANGTVVIGLTYLLITVAAGYFASAPAGSGVIVAIGLSFSIPFTLLPELAIGNFAPNATQYVGIAIFMALFVTTLLAVSARGGAEGAEPR